ncbi:hypothetical protein TCAL_00307 [Tigriopus californicus]|uniref:dolichol kinase n=1 Tax=Tigriopus californicus TaxID=6832 RepID=A0A553P2B4_TIGCA|nr:dolichol kinase-like [Tigriopus californicus]TRY71837.1 hypothetical protein TCAL_00307 [Tigriopus californicus]
MSFRTPAQHGLWCLALLPCALLSSFTDDFDPYPVKSVTLFLSLCFVLISVLTAYHVLYTVADERKVSDFASHVFKAMVSDLFERASSQEVRLRRTSQDQLHYTPTYRQRNHVYVVTALLNGIFVLFLKSSHHKPFHPFTLATGSMSLWSFAIILPQMFRLFPRSFTFGEGTLILQGVVLFLFESVNSLFLIIDNPATEEGSFSIIGKTGLLACSVVCILPLLPGFKWCGKNTWFAPTGFTVLFGMAVPYLWFTLQRNPILWTMDQILNVRARVLLMICWALCLLIAVLKVQSQNEYGQKASTRTRKYFHVIMVMVYTSGVIVDPLFLYLSSIVAQCVFMLLESIRYYCIQPFSQYIQSSFAVFLDEKDNGSLILTHIYLLIGCSLPLWLCHGVEAVTRVQLLSGVLCIGIGDSAASYFGSKFGRFKFPDSSKSVEGTVASIVTQLMFLHGLDYFGFIIVTDWLPLYLPVIIVSVVEALTTQVDNLVLPLLFYALL